MKIYTKLELLKTGKVIPDVAQKMSEHSDEVLAYTDDMSGTMDFATAKVLAPILDRTDLCDINSAGGRDGMLVTAAISAALSPDGRAALVLGEGTGKFAPIIDGKQYEVLVGRTIGELYGSASSPTPAVNGTQKKKPAAPVTTPSPAPDAKKEPVNADTGSTPGNSILEDLEVDEEILEPFMAYIPDDCGIEGVSAKDFGKALYKALSESTSDADAVTRLETYVGADAGNVMKIIKERGLYSELRDLALL